MHIVYRLMGQRAVDEGGNPFDRLDSVFLGRLMGGEDGEGVGAVRRQDKARAVDPPAAFVISMPAVFEAGDAGASGGNPPSLVLTDMGEELHEVTLLGRVEQIAPCNPGHQVG